MSEGGDTHCRLRYVREAHLLICLNMKRGRVVGLTLFEWKSNTIVVERPRLPKEFSWIVNSLSLADHQSKLVGYISRDNIGQMVPKKTQKHTFQDATAYYPTGK